MGVTGRFASALAARPKEQDVMAQTTGTTPLSYQTQLWATTHTHLDPVRPILLGTFQGPRGRHALLRDPQAGMRRVYTGDWIGQARITSITVGQLELSLLDQTYTLTIPGTD